jgi:hypothetical protein
MVEDPVVEEVHKTRKKLLKRHRGLEGFSRYLRDIERELKNRVVTHEPKRPSKTRRIS